MLPVVRAIMEEVGLNMDEALEDSSHMSEIVTKSVNWRYWQHIDDLQRARGPEIAGSELCVLVRGFNTSQAKLKSDWQEHASFWHGLTNWGAVVGPDREALRDMVTRSLGRQGPSADFYDKISETPTYEPKVWFPGNDAGGAHLTEFGSEPVGGAGGGPARRLAS